MLAVNFSPFPVLETERLLLRRINDDDAQQIFSLRSNPENMKYVPRPLAKTIDDARNHVRLINEKIDSNAGINWAITRKGSDLFIGIIGHYELKPEHYRSEIGYMMLPEYQGQGYTTEAIKIALDYGFDVLKLHSVEAIIDPDNIASARVLEKNGFLKEAHLRENEFYNGRFLDSVIYGILDKDHRL